MQGGNSTDKWSDLNGSIDADLRHGEADAQSALPHLALAKRLPVPAPRNFPFIIGMPLLGDHRRVVLLASGVQSHHAASMQPVQAKKTPQLTSEESLQVKR